MIDVRNKNIKCKNCGNSISYRPGIGLKCDYCDSDYSSLERKSKGLVYHESSEEGLLDWGDDKKTVCQNCSTTYKLEKYEIATSCPSCGKSMVMEGDDIPGMNPDSILPFSISKEKAIEIYKKWMKKGFFVPSKIKKALKVDTIIGTYIPVFTFDAYYETEYEARIGKKKTRVSSNGNLYTKTVWSIKRGFYNKDFKNILIPSLKYTSVSNFKNVQDYDCQNSIEYKEDYVAGYKAIRYQVGLDDSYKLALLKIEDIVKDDIKDLLNADEIDYVKTNPFITDRRYKYMLVPTYTATTKYGANFYTVSINGRNGEIDGDKPKSKFRVFLIGVLSFIVVLLFVLKYLKYI